MGLTRYFTNNFYTLKGIFLEERSVAFIRFPKSHNTQRVRVLKIISNKNLLYTCSYAFMFAWTRMVWKDISFMNLCYYLVIISMYLFSIQKTSNVKKKLTEKILKSSNYSNLPHEVSPKNPANFFLTMLLSWQNDVDVSFFF